MSVLQRPLSTKADTLSRKVDEGLPTTANELSTVSIYTSPSHTGKEQQDHGASYTTVKLPLSSWHCSAKKILEEHQQRQLWALSSLPTHSIKQLYSSQLCPLKPTQFSKEDPWSVELLVPVPSSVTAGSTLCTYPLWQDKFITAYHCERCDVGIWHGCPHT